MRHAFIVALIASTVTLLVACGSSEPGPVQVIGPSQDLQALTGEWVGTYEGVGTGRIGSITFHLTENPEGAHGDVLMVPKQQFVRDAEQPAAARAMPAHVLAIEFVRITAGEISGKIEPYSDPDLPSGRLETHFIGRVEGDWIEGTFVTYSDQGASPQRGTWRVHRNSGA